MPGAEQVKLLARITDKVDQSDTLPSLETRTDMVDSMIPPYPAEFVSAQHALVHDCAILQRIDEDIEACQMRIAHAHAQVCLLEQRRNAVEHRLSIHRARLSPVRSVPDQVLQEIFRHCLPDIPYLVPNARSAPLVLTHVCRRWRVVAHGTSELWASIALQDRGVWNYELDVEMVKHWLDRSYTRPICMSITCTPCTDFGLRGNAMYSDIFQLAIAHSTHLKKLCLNVNRTYLHNFMTLARLPALRSVVVALHADQRVDDAVEPAVISAPHLTHVAFHGDGTSIHLIPPSLFPQITHLAFNCNLTLDLARLFQDFSRLQHVALTFSLSRDPLRFRLPSQGERRILAPSLRTLEVRLDKDMIEFGDPETLATLLDALELPALQVLAIVAPPRWPLPGSHAAAAAAGDDVENREYHNHMLWVHSPSVCALLSRSRYLSPRVEQCDVAVPARQGHVYQEFENEGLINSESTIF